MVRVAVWVDTVTNYGLGQSVALAPESRVKVTHFTPAEQNRKEYDKAVSELYNGTFYG